jgi:hypothetical protein
MVDDLSMTLTHKQYEQTLFKLAHLFVSI